MNKQVGLSLDLFVFLLAAVIVANSQFAALTNEYVLNGDVFQAIYWMRQFHDSELFRRDLLTEYAKHYHSPWGVLVLYRGLSILLDPITISKILPLILFPLSSLYMFKLVRYFANGYAGFLAALVFMITPIFPATMVGGYARAFAYPLLLIFLYHLVKQEYTKSSLVLVAQCLFYPMVFLVSALTYTFNFIKIERYRISLEVQRGKFVSFVLAGGISLLILSAQHLLTNDSAVGTIVTRSQVVNRPEFTASGRAELLPTTSLSKAIMGLSAGSIFSIVEKYPVAIRQINKQFLNIKTVPIIIQLLVLATLLFLTVEIMKGRISVPHELLYLFLSSVILYRIADHLLFKLYLPGRYLQYSIPVITVILISVFSAHVIAQLRHDKTKTAVRLMLFLFVGLHFNINKDVGLRDYANYRYQDNVSFNRNLFVYLHGLPKDALVAAHPYLADGIPTFSRKKVFVNAELSHPLYDNYWETIKSRTVEFFDAYYSTEPASIYQFARRHGIEYLVVDKGHFTAKYITGERIYFEPFNSHVKKLVKNKQGYALLDIPENQKLFVDGDLFVIDVEVLKRRRLM